MVLAKFEMRKDIPRCHVATAKLTCGPLVVWLSKFWRQKRRVTEPGLWCRGDIGKLGIATVRSLFIVGCSGSRNRIGVSGSDKNCRTVRRSSTYFDSYLLIEVHRAKATRKAYFTSSSNIWPRSRLQEKGLVAKNTSSNNCAPPGIPASSTAATGTQGKTASPCISSHSRLGPGLQGGVILVEAGVGHARSEVFCQDAVKTLEAVLAFQPVRALRALQLDLLVIC